MRKFSIRLLQNRKFGDNCLFHIYNDCYGFIKLVLSCKDKLKCKKYNF